MDSKYQKYYDALNGKDFSSYVSKYSSALSTVSTSFGNMESIMSSSWTEKGLEYIKSTIIPSLKSQVTGIEQGLSTLSSIILKCSTLSTKLGDLKSLCDAYASCKKEEKANYESRIKSLEGEIDSLVSDINGTSLEIKNVSTTYDGYIDELNELSSIGAKRKEFIGDVNDTSAYYLDPKYPNIRKDLAVFDNTTGEILGDEDTIYLKRGETRVLTVKLPYNAGTPKRIVRTTAADVSNPNDTYKITSSKSDINPDPNVVDYVNYKHNYWPEGVDLHTNYYDWIITADKTGSRQISQTCEYETMEGGTPKSMIGINIVVVD